jgi:hypothetical protein
MLNRPIPIREALVHSIPISEVKDMKSDVVWALKTLFLKKKTLNLVCGLNFNNCQEEKLHKLCNFSSFLQHFHCWDRHFLNQFEIC